MVIGFTGTRNGMSAAQRRQFGDVIAWLIRACEARLEPISFHHGAAPGADTEAAEIAAAAPYVQIIKVVPHPAGRDPLARNRDIARLCSLLIAAPDRDQEEQRSGTWATIRYARAEGRPVVMLSRGRKWER